MEIPLFQVILEYVEVSQQWAVLPGLPTAACFILDPENKHRTLTAVDCTVRISQPGGQPGGDMKQMTIKEDLEKVSC